VELWFVLHDPMFHDHDQARSTIAAMIRNGHGPRPACLAAEIAPPTRTKILDLTSSL